MTPNTLRTVASLGMLLIGGCASVDYAPPASGPKATITVTSTNPAINIPVRVHGPLVCTSDTSHRVGWLNSRVAGAPHTGNTLTFDVPAGEPIGVSVVTPPAAATGNGASPGALVYGCDQVLDFTPAAGARYALEAETIGHGQCSYRLTRIDNGRAVLEPSAAVRDTCTVALN